MFSLSVQGTCLCGDTHLLQHEQAKQSGSNHSVAGMAQTPVHVTQALKGSLSGLKPELAPYTTPPHPSTHASDEDALSPPCRSPEDDVESMQLQDELPPSGLHGQQRVKTEDSKLSAVFCPSAKEDLLGKQQERNLHVHAAVQLCVALHRASSDGVSSLSLLVGSVLTCLAVWQASVSALSWLLSITWVADLLGQH